jgi:hypothetical protein
MQLVERCNPLGQALGWIAEAQTLLTALTS